jgi:hypothetical protein
MHLWVGATSKFAGGLTARICPYPRIGSINYIRGASLQGDKIQVRACLKNTIKKICRLASSLKSILV